MTNKMDALEYERQRVEDLKASWVEDPSWDIECTADFEGHYFGLRSFRLEMQAKWQQADRQKLLKKARELGITDNLRLAHHILLLEERLADLERGLV
jgi:hypothetical protein